MSGPSRLEEGDRTERGQEETLLRLRMWHPNLRRALQAEYRSLPAAAGIAAALLGATLACGGNMTGILGGAAAVLLARTVKGRGRRQQERAEALLRVLQQLPEGRRRQLLKETAGDTGRLRKRLQADTLNGAEEVQDGR